VRSFSRQALVAFLKDVSGRNIFLSDNTKEERLNQSCSSKGTTPQGLKYINPKFRTLFDCSSGCFISAALALNPHPDMVSKVGMVKEYFFPNSSLDWKWNIVVSTSRREMAEDLFHQQ
jgi:hypothetical protein